jgi:hypothetical protein
METYVFMLGIMIQNMGGWGRGFAEEQKHRYAVLFFL